MIITPPSPEQATGHVADMYAGDLSDDGFVYAHTRAMAMHPEVHTAFENLVGAVAASLGVRDYELVTLAAARAIGSPHCLLAHGRKTLRAGLMDEDQLVRVARDHDDADLTDAEVAMMGYAARLSTDAAAMTDADSQSLRNHGFTDAQIADITFAAAARNFLSRSLLALAVPVDDVPGLTPRLRDALLGAASDTARPASDIVSG
jgi:uncharacterized peroxidase-related enzyme